MELLILASGGQTTGLPAGAIVLIVAIVAIPAAVGVYFGEKHLRRRGVAWRDSAGKETHRDEESAESER
jgi:hypothetical protein